MMKNLRSNYLLAFTLIVTVSYSLCTYGYDWATNPGNGDVLDPYQVSTAEQLMSIGSDPNLMDKAFVLMNNINLDPALPGNVIFDDAVIAASSGSEFTGIFNGDGYSVRNLEIYNVGADGDNIGLFKNIGEDGRVMNLGLLNASISGYSAVGPLCAVNNGEITHCFSGGTVYGRTYIGGLCGRNCGEMTDCYSSSEAEGTMAYIGGLCGRNESNITGCYFSGVVDSPNETGVGGVCGYNYSTAVVTNCYSVGEVIANSNVGGLCGINNGEITKCYAVGPVTGNSNVGALCGNNGGSIVTSYFLDTAGPDNGNGTPLTNEEMKQQANFIGWNKIEIWSIYENQSYPLLRRHWPSDFDKDGQTDLEDFALFAKYWLAER